MSDLIDRQAAIDATEIFIKDCNPEHFVGHPNFIEYMDSVGIQSFGNWQYANGFNMGLTAAEVAIKKLPSAQPERKTGRWIKSDVGIFQFDCSECLLTFQVDTLFYKPLWRYCPNCGARMDGGIDNETD